MPNPTRADRDLMRAINRSAVLNTIKNHGPLPRAEIARTNNLSAATVTAIVAELIGEGLVIETEAGSSSGGRRPILLALNPRGGFVIGIKLAEHTVTGALTDLEATVLGAKTAVLPAHPDIPAVLDTVAGVVDALLAEAGIGREHLLGAGLGVAGAVDPGRGVLRYNPFFAWRDLPLADLLQERLGVPVAIDNDVNTLTISELWFGRGKGTSNFLVVTVGRGIGLGIVLNGQVYLAAQGGAGEFGHTVIDPDGPLCECGKRGCLEVYASDPALLRAAAAARARGDLPAAVNDLDTLLAAAESGTQAAQDIYAHAGEVLGMGIANLINILNPQLILISGEGVRAGELLFGPMREAIDGYVMPGLAGDTAVEVDPWDDYGWAQGAAGLVLQQLFESPLQRAVREVA